MEEILTRFRNSPRVLKKRLSSSLDHAGIDQYTDDDNEDLFTGLWIFRGPLSFVTTKTANEKLENNVSCQSHVFLL
jgi:hypothetical protein